jgi:hypothetical protein
MPPLRGWVVLLGRRIPWLARHGPQDIARCAGSAPIGWLILAPMGQRPRNGKTKQRDPEGVAGMRHHLIDPCRVVAGSCDRFRGRCPRLVRLKAQLVREVYAISPLQVDVTCNRT